MADILTARPTRTGRWFWRTFSHWSIRLCFEKVEAIGLPILANDQPVLMIANHVSWWDGFWANEMNNRYFKRDYFVMMLEEQLKTRPFLRQGGAFSIHPGKRSIIHSLRYTAELLHNPDNLVLIFPQGKIHSLYQTEFVFMRGLDRAFKQLTNPIQVLFAVAMVDYFSAARPTLSYYFSLAENQEQVSAALLEQKYQAFYAACLQQQKQEV